GFGEVRKFMPTTYSRQGELNLKPRPKAKSKRPLFLGIVGLGLFLYFAPDSWWTLPTRQVEKAALQQIPEEAKAPVIPKTTPFHSSVNPHAVLVRQTPTVRPYDNLSARKPVPSVEQRSEPAHHVQELDTLVTKVKSMKEITAEEAATIQEMLAALQKQGVKA